MTYRPLLAALLAASLTGAPAHADESVVATIHAAAAEHGVSGEALVALARCESNLVATARGDSGRSHGLMQIHDQGLFRHFTAQGYTSRDDPAQAAEYVARIAAGHWPGVRVRDHWAVCGRRAGW